MVHQSCGNNFIRVKCVPDGIPVASTDRPELEISNLQIYFTEPPNIDELVYCSYLVRYAKSIDYTISDKVVIRTFDLDFKNGQLQQTTDGFLPLASYPDKQQNPKLYYFLV